MDKVKVRTSDGIIFRIDREVADHMGTLRRMLRDYNINQLDQRVVQLHMINSATFNKLLEWCTYHKDPKDIHQKDCRSMEDEDCPTYRSRWEAHFLDVSDKVLVHFIMAAVYMDIRCLLKKACTLIYATGREELGGELKAYLETKVFL